MRGLILSLLIGCSRDESAVEAPAVPLALDGQDCAVCGMTVDEQPAPRAQVLRRDGTTDVYCSLGDLLVAHAAPSPHGSAVATWVEALPGDFDPAATRSPPLPWLPASDAHFVVGVARPGVMGTPALTYDSAERAAAAAGAHGGQVVRWSQFVAGPGGEAP